MTEMADVREQLSALELVMADQRDRIGGLEAKNAAPLHDQVFDLERLNARQQATVQRQAAIMKQKRDRAER